MLDKSPRPAAVNVPNDLAAHWMPFTANRAFKKNPRMLAGAKDMHYFTVDGRKIIDAAAGMWCCNAGHGRPQIAEAIGKMAATLDYAPPFQFGIPQAFELASRIADLAPAGLDHVFFCNSGSEAADTALKIALAYHQISGQGGRTRLIGRERGYHGVGFGGTSVGGIVGNRKIYGSLLSGVDHISHTYDREKQAFSKGEPEYGAHFADDVERLVNLHGANTIAAVIVEPMAGSTGVLPAPKGYLKRLREITQKHGILLIFDEVITGYGRLGFAFAAERYGVLPDMLTFAKGITNGAAPMGGVLVRDTIHDAFMNGPEHVVELTHGYTYSAHPIACAAALATLDIYRDEKLFERAKMLEPKFADAVMSLKNEPNVVDIRTVGLTAGIDLTSLPGPARQARLRRAQQRLPRQRPDDARRRRHAGADAALDHHRGPDRRDRRQGRQGDPRGGVGLPLPLAGRGRIRISVRGAGTLHLFRSARSPSPLPASAGRGATAVAQHHGTFKTSPRSFLAGRSASLRWRNDGHARALERIAAHRAGAQTEPGQTGDAVLSARPHQPGDRHRHLLCGRHRAVCRRRHFPDRGASLVGRATALFRWIEINYGLFQAFGATGGCWW